MESGSEFNIHSFMHTGTASPLVATSFSTTQSKFNSPPSCQPFHFTFLFIYLFIYFIFFFPTIIDSVSGVESDFDMTCD